MSTADRRIAAGLFLLAFGTYAWFFGGGGWNQNASFDLTRAIVERGTFRIDAYAGNTYDISFHAGHTYANKAPGLSLLGAIPYAVLYAIERAGGADVNSFRVMNGNLYACTVAVCATSGALLVAIFFLYGRRIGVPATHSLTIALVIAFMTFVFEYSTVFFAHTPTALFLFWSFARLTGNVDQQPWIGGALGGMAMLCSYPALLPLAVVVVTALTVSGARVRRAYLIAAGAAPFFIALVTYQTLCFGSPFRTAVEATSNAFLTPGALLGVFVAPKIGVLHAITIAPYRGLFFLSPILVYAIGGAMVMFRRRLMLRELAVVSGVLLTLLAINVSFNGWHGGSAIGPRYILPVVPFLAIPMLFAVEIFRPLWVALAAISFVFNFAATAVNPMPSRLIADPIFHYTLPLLFTGHLPRDTPSNPPLAWKRMLGHVSVNRLGADDLVPFHKHPPGSPESEWASFNLGEVIAPGSLMSLVPVLVWIIGGSGLLLRQTHRAAVG